MSQNSNKILKNLPEFMQTSSKSTHNFENSNEIHCKIKSMLPTQKIKKMFSSSWIKPPYRFFGLATLILFYYSIRTTTYLKKREDFI
jgi:hypothetical protein